MPEVDAPRADVNKTGSIARRSKGVTVQTTAFHRPDEAE